MFSILGKLGVALLAGLAIAAERSCAKVGTTASHVAERAAPKIGKIEVATAETGTLAGSDATKRLEPKFNIEAQPSRTVDNAFAPIYGNADRELRTRTTFYFTLSEQQVLRDLSILTPPISISDADRIVRKRVVEAIVSDSQKAASPVKFEVLSGKLKIDGSKEVLGINASFGEVNVYKVSFALAGLIAACKGVIVESFKPCVEVALKKAEALIAKEIGITADAATKK